MAFTGKRVRKTEVEEAPKSAPVRATADAPKTKPALRIQPDRTAIALRAWEIWQKEGCPEGRALNHWLRAEQELMRELSR
jgi:hypothetical protein